MDYESFLSLCMEDLVEMGIGDPQDRQRLMTLITRLHKNTGENHTSLVPMVTGCFSPNAASSSMSDVFK